MSNAAVYCRNCGKTLTEEERANPSSIYCAVCAPAAAPPAPPYQAAAPPPVTHPAYPPQPVGTGVSPGLAFLLGLLPGVGAIYNGQYAKGLVHVVVFGLLLSINGSDIGRSELEPLFVLMIPTWICYMAFEAYHTARRRLAGETVDEFSSLVPLRRAGGFPVAPVLMIAVGLLFLLHNLDVLRIGQLMRYWPVFLIALGAYMLYVRVTGSVDETSLNRREAHHEQ